jgi:hypothetical protein
MTLRRRYTVAWLIWLGLTLLSFGAIEIPALLDPSGGDTLTEHVAAFLDGGPLRYLLIGGPLLWVALHLLTRGRLG